MSATCSKEGCNDPSMEDYERCAYHRAEWEEECQTWVKGGLGTLGTIALILFGRGGKSS